MTPFDAYPDLTPLRRVGVDADIGAQSLLAAGDASTWCGAGLHRDGVGTRALTLP